MCTVFIDVLHEAIVEFNDEAPTWDLTRDTTKPKFDLKYIENHPTRKYCEQGANQVRLIGIEFATEVNFRVYSVDYLGHKEATVESMRLLHFRFLFSCLQSVSSLASRSFLLLTC